MRSLPEGLQHFPSLGVGGGRGENKEAGRSDDVYRERRVYLLPRPALTLTCRRV